jgi:hypothetical protein
LSPHPDAGFVPYVLVEEVSYLPIAPWPVAADGTGRALVRKGPALFANDPANWAAEATAPIAPVVSVSASSAGLVLSFPAETGRTYRLQRRATLASGSWDAGVAISDPPSGGTAAVNVTPAAGGVEFYRVTVE